MATNETMMVQLKLGYEDMDLYVDSAQQATHKASDEEWVVGADRDLDIVEWGSWDAQKARDSMFEEGFDVAKRGHLVYDRNNPELKKSYKLPFAAVEDGKLVAVKEGLRAAASRLPQTDIPDDVKERARSVLDAYFERMDQEDNKQMVLSMTKSSDVVVEHNGKRISMGKYTIESIKTKPGKLTIELVENR